MKKNFIYFLNLIFALGMLSCGGGGGGEGGSSNPPKPTYLKVVSVSPANLATKVAYDSPIKLNFSENIDTAAFVNTKAKIGGLLLSQGLSVLHLEGFVALTETEAAELTLKDFESGKYIVTADPEDEESFDIIYSFQINESSMTSTLVLSTTAGKEYSFSHKSLKDTGLFDQNMIQLKNSAGEIVKTRLMSELYNQVELVPFDYLDYEETYTISVSTSLVSTAGRKLQTSFQSSFTIAPLPPVDYVFYGPQGSDSSPVESASLEVNFNLDSDISLDSAIKIYEISEDNSGAEVSTEVAVEKSISENKRNIVLTKAPYWKYGTKYRVTVDGSYLTGSVGNSGNLSLKDKNLDWTFITALAKVEEITPKNSSSSSRSAVNTAVKVKLNFPVSLAIADQYIQILDQNGQSVSYNSSFTSQNQTEVKLQPVNNLAYYQTYTILVKKGIHSYLDNQIATKQDYQSLLYTTEKKVSSLVPYSGQSSVPSNTDIKISFNFAAEIDPKPYIKIYEKFDGLTSSIDYKYVLSSDKKTITLTPLHAGSARNFFFNAEVEVEINNAIAGSDIAGFVGLSYKFTIENSELTIWSSSPYDGESLVSVSEDMVSVTFNKEIFQDSRIDTPIWIEYTNCNGKSGIIDEGIYNYSGASIYFDPYNSDLPDDSYLASDCKHTIHVDPELTGIYGEAFESSSKKKTTFTTDYLEITRVAGEFAYGDRIAKDSVFEIEFSHNLSSFYHKSNFELLRENFFPESFNTSKSGKRIILDPSFNLEYGTEYRLWIHRSPDSSYQDPIRAVSGERLVENTYLEFQVENMPLEIVSYYPTGSYVATTSDLYIQTNFSKYDNGYPSKVEFNISAEYYDYDLEAYKTYYYDSYDYSVSSFGRDIDVSFDEDLFYDAYYDIEVSFTFEDGEKLIYAWTFETESSDYEYSGVGIASATNNTKPKSIGKAKRKDFDISKVLQKIFAKIDPVTAEKTTLERTQLRSKSSLPFQIVTDSKNLRSEKQSRESLQRQNEDSVLKRIPVLKRSGTMLNDK